MRNYHDDDCSSTRGFECDCGYDDELEEAECGDEFLQYRQNVGRQVLSKYHYAFPAGEKAEIVGFQKVNNRVCYTIRFDDMQTDMIPADEKLLSQSGFEML